MLKKTISKKIFLFLLTLLGFVGMKAQTCSSPVLLDGLNGAFSARDSFNVQDRFFKFTANNVSQTIKVYVKNLSTLGGNIYVNLYSNNCASLTVSQVTVTPTISGDTIILNPNSIAQGQEYLVEIGKVVNNSSYVVYSLSVNNFMSTSSWGCTTNTPCPITGTCELVCNGSFEQMSDPTNNGGYLYNAYNWNSANNASPDLLSSGASSSFYQTPCNFAGSESPYVNPNCTTNNNYAGIYTEDNVAPLYAHYSEYIQTQLTTTLTAGQKYIVSFFVSKGENETATLNALGIYLTNLPLFISGSGTLSATPNLSVTNTTLLNSTSGWTQIILCYYATGGEQYLTIGRPAGSITTVGSAPSIVCISSPPVNATYGHYLYIDNVSLKPFIVSATSNTSSVDVCGSVNLNTNFSCGAPNLTLLTYNWSGTGLSSTTIANPTATLNSTSNYFVTVQGYGSDGFSCSNTGNITITSNTVNALSLSSSVATVCPNSTVSISGSLTSGTGSYTYTPGGNVGNNIVFSPSITTTYTVSGTGGNGCIQTKTITIYTYTNNINVSASPSSICTGFSSTLTASNGSGFTWQPGSLPGTTVVVSPTVTTTYSATGTTTDGCIRTNTVTVTVNNPSAMTISPATSNSICLNSSIGLSASGASTYTWQPGNITGSGITVTPTVNTTYTVSGTNSFGCVGTKTVSVFINSLPSVGCSTSNTATCPGISATLSASGASTYTWLPSTNSQTIVVSPTVTTSYTVVGTSAIGCTNSCVVTQSVYPANIFTVTATPSVVCGSTGGGPSTIIATPSSPSTYTWLPSNTVSYSLAVTTSSISSPVYTVVSTSSLGCIASQTAHINVSDGYAALTLTDICQTTTLNLSSYASPYPSGTFSINGVPSTTLFSQSPGTYTVTYTNTSALLCGQTATAAIQVFSVPATPTVAGSPNFVCGGQSLTLTANPTGGAPSYVWPSTTFTGNPYIFTPTASASYSVMAVNGACSVTSANEFAFTATPLACNCVQNCVASLSYTQSTNPTSGQVYCVPGDLYISGNITISNCDLKIAPGVTITILPSSTLTLAGCHLYACDQMWQGIIVQQGGKLIINSGTRTSFIEDALVAVDMLPTTSYTSTANILTVDNVTFNRNQIGIRIGDYLTSQTVYPFSIQNSLFTSRTLTSTALSYQNTSTIKNGASGNTSPLQTPYVSNTLTPTTLKNPNSTLYPAYGIYLTNVGYTNSNGNVWYNLAIGNSTNSANFNCFDNLYEDIDATNSNFQVTNNVFQNGVRHGHLSVLGGQGIVANSITTSSTSPQNNQVLIQSVIGTTTLGNQFYEKTAAADLTGYINTIIENNAVYSYANAYSLFNTANAIGNHGFNVTTNRYYAITMQKNKIYNIKNAMLVNLDNGPYSVGTQSGNGRLVGNVTVSTNTVNRHPTTAVAGEFVHICANLNDPYATASTTLIGAGSSSNVFFNNNFTNVHNGIGVANVGFSGVTSSSNTINMVNEPNTFGAPIQNGVLYNQLHIATVNQNNISGPASYTNAIYAIQTSLNNTLTVKCNTTTNTYYGLNFNGNQALTSVQDNIMQTHTYGLSLTNTATIGQQGTTSNPPLNQWTGTYTATAGTYKTMNYNVYSSAQNSKMYAAWGATTTIDPNNSSTVIATPGTMPLDDYFHQTSNPANTILNYTVAYTLGCRLSGGGGGGGGGRLIANPDVDYSSKISLMELLVGDTSLNSGISPATNFIGRNVVYRQLQGNLIDAQGSNVLTTFYNTAQTTALQKFYAIEEDLMHTDYTNAQAKISGLDQNNSVEVNYQGFYNLYISTKMATFNSADSITLLNLANMCPYTQGGVVYQARALYNMLYTTFGKFKNNCFEDGGNRLFESKVINNSDIKVELKTKLYPNPNNGEFTIAVPNLKENKKIEVLVFDMLGKLVYSEVKMANDNATLLKPNLINGTYIVKIKLPDGTFDMHRLIIEK